ncbi:MAG TPA: alpha-glucan family phosphorylase [Blastocatellia bacterium]|nr:alpha-glucan family phosphorylase [Blastocatellia bacterium]
MTAIDPVCGMPVDEASGISIDRDGRRLWFCTEFCKEQYLRHPGAYEPSVPDVPREVGWETRRVAYFTMEVALSNVIPTYAGGLGVLAGDTLRSLADLEVPAVCVTLAHRRGYLRQELRDGRQTEHDAIWHPERIAGRLTPAVAVEIESRSVWIRAWQYNVVGSSGYVVPVILLDSDMPENTPDDRQITDRLYGGDDRYRLMQEIVLGVGGVRMLQALHCTGLTTFHLNEGHAALAPLELLRARSGDGGQWDFQWVRNHTVFTTHTPVAAGRDQFDRGLVRQVLGDAVPGDVLDMLTGRGRLDMTLLALNLSHYVNGVALRHREVSSDLFPGYEIHQITNGVHSRTWTSRPFRDLFDRRIPGWREDPFMLRNATALPPDEVWEAHQCAKYDLLDLVLARTGRRFRGGVLTLGFARRATTYKRPGLVFSDISRLRSIAGNRPLQIVFAGKAHPRDEPGKASVAGIIAAGQALGDDLPVVYLEDYDLELGLQLVAGTDLWLNTPQRPLEASGTSGMKAAHNGVPSFSVLDGWWREGHVEGVTGWSIGASESGGDDGADARDLYEKLEQRILPMFYEQRAAWVRVMQQSIALNASFFNTHRMVRQYLMHAYAVGADLREAGSGA